MSSYTKQNSIKTFMLATATVVASAVLVISLIGSINAKASSSVAYSNTFENSIDDWSNGVVTRTASDADGISSSNGGFHGVVTGSSSTKLGGYSSIWPGEWSTSIDVYLDPSWDVNTGFIYSIGVNKTDGTNMRDHIITAGVINDATTGNVNKLVATGSYEGFKNGDVLYQLNNYPSRERAEIATAGWYTITNTFRNNNGKLHTVASISTKAGVELGSWTDIGLDPSNPDQDGRYLIPGETGGNRYGWFTHVTVPGGVAIDNVTRSVTNNEFAIPEDAVAPVNVTLQDGKAISVLGVSNGVVTLPVDMTIKGQSTGVSVVIPEGTVVTAADSAWDGTLQAPAVDSTKTVTVDGVTYSVEAAYKVGSQTPLTFSAPVKVVIPGKANSNAGYIDNSNAFHAIKTKCGTDPAATITGDVKECYATEGNDLVIWTNHFTVFVAYSSSELGAPNTGLASSNLTLATVSVALGATGLVIIIVTAIRRKSRDNNHKK